MIFHAKVEPSPASGGLNPYLMPAATSPASGRHRPLLALCAAFALAFGAPSERTAAQMENGVALVKADLIADTTAVQPGKAFTVGLRLKMAPHWHTYWQYSGDAGLPTKIDWELPDGFKAGPIQWPLPDKIETPGDIINYGYSEEVVLLTEITPPTQPAGGEVTFKAKATWLVCAEKCIPGEAALSLKLPVGGNAQAANVEVFNKYRAMLPTPADPKTAGVGLQGKYLTFQLNGAGSAPSAAEFFPLPGDTAEVGHPAAAKIMTVAEPPSWGAFAVVEMVSDPKDADQIGGVWTLTDKDGKKTGISVAPKKPVVSGSDQTSAQPSPSPAPAVAANTLSGGAQNPPPGASGGPATPAGSLWHFLLLGFLGGLILNVMPCVLPVISLKLFSFVKQANEDRARVLRLGLAYAAGVFAWFLGFAGLVVGLRSAGHQVGYAFHLQNPWFLVGLSAATFVFALNLLGVFEIILPGNVTNAAAGAAGSREGYAGAFVQGVLATVLGSACTAPVFGEALAFAFSQSAVGIFAMFAAIAAGMSAPFVILAAFPAWLKFLPKPGAWMERVKQGTGFLLLATVLWLLYVLGRSKGSDGVVWTGVLLLALGVACWVQGAFNTFAAGDGTRWAARLAIAVIALGGGWFAVGQIAGSRPPETVAAGAGGFAAQLDTALKTGRTVFVDFTADWCVSCKSNERLVLSSDAVQKALQDDNVMFLKADYTTYSDDVARLLKQFNAASVPLYVVYPAGKPDAPLVLPTLLTQQIVLDTLASANGRRDAGKPLAAR